MKKASKKKITKKTFKSKLTTTLVSVFVIVSILSLSFVSVNVSHAQNPYVLQNSVQTMNMPTGSEDPTKSSFRIVTCDGPAIPPNLDASSSEALSPSNPFDFEKKFGHPPPYVACDFNGAMMQVQHLINIAMVLGVFAAIILFTYAGYLLMTGKEADRNQAKDIFQKVFIGFVIMLSAWFIVFQLLNWLTGNSGFTKLLGG